MNLVENEPFISGCQTLLSIIEKRYSKRSDAIAIYSIINFFTFIIVLIVDSIIRGNIHRNISIKLEQLSSNVTEFFLINTNDTLEEETTARLNFLNNCMKGKYDISEVEKKIKEISDSLKPKQSENNSDHAVSNEKEVIDIKPLGSENNSDHPVSNEKEVIDIDELLASDSDSDEDEYCL